MGMEYWVDQGIGVRSSRLRPHLDKQKCYCVIKELLSDDDKDISFDEFDIDDYLYGDPFDTLGDVLCQLDDTNILTYGSSGEMSDDDYLYYPPCFPWYHPPKEPQSLQEVHEIITGVLQRVTNLSKEKCEKLIEDNLYEVGCG